MSGIYCIEGDWWGDWRRQSTVVPVLDLLKVHERRPFIRRDVSTDSEFEFHLREWSAKRYVHFPYLYIALHGEEGAISIRQKKKVRYDHGTVDLEWLEDKLADRCGGRVLMFASCSTMAAHGNRLKSFVRKIGARAALGYRSEVDWTQAATFELALFSMLPMHKRPHTASLKAAIRKLKAVQPVLTKKLGFYAVYP